MAAGWTGRARLLAAAALAAALAVAPPAKALEIQDIRPGDSHIRFSVRALGAMTLHGEFFAFTGRIEREGAACRVRLRVEAGSLRMAREGWTHLAIGPRVLDAARFPSLAFSGTCAPRAVSGTLSLHGVTRPIGLTVTQGAGTFIAAGAVERADFGIGGPWLLGPRVHISIEIPVPAAALPSPRPSL